VHLSFKLRTGTRIRVTPFCSWRQPDLVLDFRMKETEAKFEEESERLRISEEKRTAVMETVEVL
jgi:hypothetical protein